MPLHQVADVVLGHPAQCRQHQHRPAEQRCGTQHSQVGPGWAPLHAQTRQCQQRAQHLGSGIGAQQPQRTGLAVLQGQPAQAQATHRPDDLKDAVGHKGRLRAGPLGVVQIERLAGKKQRQREAGGPERVRAGQGPTGQRGDQGTGRHAGQHHGVFSAQVGGQALGVFARGQVAQRIDGKPAQATQVGQLLRHGDEGEHAHLGRAQPVGPDDDRHQLRQRRQQLRGQVFEGVADQHHATRRRSGRRAAAGSAGSAKSARRRR